MMKNQGAFDDRAHPCAVGKEERHAHGIKLAEEQHAHVPGEVDLTRASKRAFRSQLNILIQSI